jgi:hypothetical protein
MAIGVAGLDGCHAVHEFIDGFQAPEAAAPERDGFNRHVRCPSRRKVRGRTPFTAGILTAR